MPSDFKGSTKESRNPVEKLGAVVGTLLTQPEVAKDAILTLMVAMGVYLFVGEPSPITIGLATGFGMTVGIFAPAIKRGMDDVHAGERTSKGRIRPERDDRTYIEKLANAFRTGRIDHSESTPTVSVKAPSKAIPN